MFISLKTSIVFPDCKLLLKIFKSYVIYLFLKNIKFGKPFSMPVSSCITNVCYWDVLKTTMFYSQTSIVAYSLNPERIVKIFL